MYNFSLIGDKPNNVRCLVKNIDTVAIPLGTPVAFKMSGTDDGIGVVLPSTALAALANSLFAGIVCAQTIPVNGFGDVVMAGYVTNVLITIATRATSTDSFASQAALSVGQLLQPETVGNRMSTVASIGASAFAPFAVLCQTLASGSSSASTTANTGTAVTALVKAFLRAM